MRVYRIRLAFEVERDSSSTKSINIFCYQTTLMKIQFLFLASAKGEYSDKSQFIAEFVRIIVTTIFSYKNVS